jgi:hypothetical protein
MVFTLSTGVYDCCRFFVITKFDIVYPAFAALLVFTERKVKGVFFRFAQAVQQQAVMPGFGMECIFYPFGGLRVEENAEHTAFTAAGIEFQPVLPAFE